MSPDPANSHQTGLVLSPPDPVNSHLTGLVPSPDPVDNSYLENQAVNTDNILSMLDMFNDNDILPEENIAEGALSTDFFDGLGDLDCLGPVGQNADFSTYGMASTGDDYLDFMELIDLDSEMFWQSAAEPKLDPK